jgi:hypothetical protein
VLTPIRELTVPLTTGRMERWRDCLVGAVQSSISIASLPARGIYTVPSLGGDERLVLEDAVPGSSAMGVCWSAGLILTE